MMKIKMIRIMMGVMTATRSLSSTADILLLYQARTYWHNKISKTDESYFYFQSCDFTSCRMTFIV